MQNNVPKLYLASPLFNASERAHNEALDRCLAQHFEVFLPQRDGALLPELLTSGLSYVEAREKIFDSDLAAINACDVLLIVLNGRAVDEGAAFELGVAWAARKPCIGYKDDFRSLVPYGDNPMIEGALLKILRTEQELRQWAHSFRSNFQG